MLPDKKIKYRGIEFSIRTVVCYSGIIARVSRYGLHYTTHNKVYRHHVLLLNGKRVDSALTVKRARQIAKIHAAKLVKKS